MPDGPETDKPLLPAVAAGERPAMESCLERYEGLVWALARRMLGDGPEAEDAVQDVFIELWKSAGRFNPRAGSEATFVVTVARRRLIDARRRRASRPDWDSLDALASEPAAEAAEPSRLDDAGVRALAALARLPDEQRSLMQWAFADGLSHAEIAERTGTPLGTVKSLIRRGLARVREAMEVQA
jgi:RNA polymerase sigma-70 factor (ECF subfamily)